MKANRKRRQRKIYPLNYLRDVVQGIEPLTRELAKRVWSLRAGGWRYIDVVYELCNGEGDDLKAWGQIGQGLSNRAVRFLGKLNQRPQLDRERCLEAARQYHEYYTEHLAQRADYHWSPERTQYWTELTQIVAEWQDMLISGSFDERRIAALETMLAAKWGEEHSGCSWAGAAPSIDAWLRSLGRPGLGDNPWFPGWIFSDVMGIYPPG